jgi:hypothetical protein
MKIGVLDSVGLDALIAGLSGDGVPGDRTDVS